MRALGGVARLARGLRDRPPLPAAAAALHAPQREPPLGPGADPRGRGGLDPLPEPVPCLSCAARPRRPGADRRLPRRRRRRLRPHPRAPPRGARALRAQGARPRLRARRGRGAGGDAAREPRAAARRPPHRAAPVALSPHAQLRARRARARAHRQRERRRRRGVGRRCARPRRREPDAVVESRGNVRDLLGDLAGLPAQQRHALLRREVDGVSHAALADELGVSPQATKNLVHRARTNLVKQRDARSSDCEAVRDDLLEAHDEGRRASAATYRHLATCADCRHFRAGLRATRRAAAILMPMPLMVVAVGLLTGKAAAVTAKGAMVKSAATAAAGVAITAGAVGVGVQVFGPGEPAPQSATSRALPCGRAGQGRAGAGRHRDGPQDGRARPRRRADRDAAVPGRHARRGPDRRPRGERELRPRHRRRREPQRDRARPAAAGLAGHERGRHRPLQAPGPHRLDRRRPAAGPRRERRHAARQGPARRAVPAPRRRRGRVRAPRPAGAHGRRTPPRLAQGHDRHRRDRLGAHPRGRLRPRPAPRRPGSASRRIATATTVPTAAAPAATRNASRQLEASTIPPAIAEPIAMPPTNAVTGQV